MFRSSLMAVAALALGCSGSNPQVSDGGSISASGSETGGTETGGFGETTGTTGTTGEPSTGGQTTTTADTTADTGETSDTGGSTDTDDVPLNCYPSNILAGEPEAVAEKLQGYNCVDGDVSFDHRAGEDLSLFSELRVIRGNLFTDTNTSLVSLHGLEKLESVGELNLFDTPELVDASALGGLVSVGGSFALGNAPKLVALELDSLSELGGSLHVHATSLTSLQAPALTTIPGALKLEGTMLSTLSGLANLTSLARLQLNSNDELVDLDSLSGLTSLDSLALEWNFGLTSLAALHGLTIGHGVGIGGSPKISALPQLHGEINNLRIFSNASLTDLKGMEGLTVLVGLDISDNDGLVDLKGLGEIGEELDLVKISGASLVSLEGLSDLVDVEELRISGPKLTSLAPLASLQSVKWLTIYGTKVKTLPMMPGLVSAEELSLDLNEELESLAGLDLLASVGHLSIRGNSKLATVAALYDGALIEVTEHYDVAGNTPLSSCEARALYEKLDAPPANYYCFENVVDNCSELSGCEVDVMP